MTTTTPTTYRHPKPAQQRLTHFGAALLLLVMLLAVIGQLVLVFSGVPGVFLITAVLTALLMLPVLMLISAAPPVTLSSAGITLHPHIWRERFVRWEQVRAVKPYPLLPPTDTEVVRRAAVGRRKYRPAQGIMLVIPALPPQYRVTGFFAGEKVAPVIALTNRTHVDYERLEQQVKQYLKTVLSDKQRESSS